MIDGLLKQIFTMTSRKQRSGVVVAITSVDPRAGVSYLTDLIAEELGRDNGGNVVSVDGRVFGTLEYEDCDGVLTDMRGIMGSGGLNVSHWRDSYSLRETVINQLRDKFQYVLIPCSPVTESSDALSVAPLVDGVILVIEANKTIKRQIPVVERMISASRGHLLGTILNKRAYFIPSWLYSRLSMFGL